MRQRRRLPGGRAARGFDASAYLFADGLCSSVVHAYGSRVVSTGPTTWQATARLVQQLKILIGAIGSAVPGFDAATPYEASDETWVVPA